MEFVFLMYMIILASFCNYFACLTFWDLSLYLNLCPLSKRKFVSHFIPYINTSNQKVQNLAHVLENGGIFSRKDCILYDVRLERIHMFLALP